MRRPAPRSLAHALGDVVRDVEPAGVLPRVQRAWDDAVGAELGAVAEPFSERNGVVTVRCESSVWAQELALLEPDLLQRLHGPGGPAEGFRIERLRFVVRSGSK
jgi:predicted nucleic acid-binding Zn ribbon protein